MTPEELALVSEKVGDELVSYGREILSLGQDLLKQAALLQHQTPKPSAVTPREDPPDRSVGNRGLVNETIATVTARGLKQFTRLEFEAALGLKGAATSKWLNRLIEKDIIERGQDEDGHIVYRYVRPLADEDPLFQVRTWVHERETFELADAVRETGLPEPEVVVAVTELVVEGVVAAEQIMDDEEVEGVDPSDRVSMTVYHYVPPIAGGVQSDLERKRLANILETHPVRRGEPVRIRTERKQRGARSTPGQRQKLLNQDRNWAKLQAAKTKREEDSRSQAARQRAQPKGKRGRKSKVVQ